MKRQVVRAWLSAVAALSAVHFASPVLAQGGPVGACCLQGDCEVHSQHVCGLLGGTFLGHDTDCSPNPCDAQFAGACCFAGDGDPFCVEVTEAECAHGVFQGVGTTCTGSLCNHRACCLPDGRCIDLQLNSWDDCSALGGDLLNMGSDCARANCAATCPADLSGDSIVGPADLAALLAAWGPCACAADFNASGDVGPEDLAELLAGWGACP